MPQMAKLIIVHKLNGNEEIMVNCDLIVQAWITTTQSGTYTVIKMMNGDSPQITETLHDLIRLSH
jgi:hypothetical protein